LRGPLIIGRNCSIENSYIGPYTSIDDDCRIKDSEVEYSVVMKQCNIIEADIRIERSLLGRGASIIKGNSRPRTQRFIIGDRSTIVLT
jgi:glucose-1-phosphate thymidylyltransferase